MVHKSWLGLFTWSELFFEPYLKRSLLLRHFNTSNTRPSGSRVLEKNRFLVDSSTFFQRSSNIEKAQQNANLRHKSYNKLTPKDLYATLKKVRWVPPVWKNDLENDHFQSKLSFSNFCYFFLLRYVLLMQKYCFTVFLLPFNNFQWIFGDKKFISIEKYKFCRL